MSRLLYDSLMITGFVGVMMLVIEYLNVFSRGAWQKRLAEHGWGQYLLAGLLGISPGCLGAFAVVAMFSHGVLRLGAVVTAMIATSGDESFVMFAMFPRQALLLHFVLLVFGVAAGVAVDAVAERRGGWLRFSCAGMKIHEEEPCECFSRGRILSQWKQCSAARGTLGGGLALFLLGVVAGTLGPPEWNWIRATLLVTAAGALFIVLTVPDHFLETHLWAHVARTHVPRIFLWTFAALATMHLLTDVLHLESAIREGKWLVLLVACLVGIIPESGPHLVFVTLYAQGTVPFSVLLASSIVQDGHGMLPMLAHSRRAFFTIKTINLVVGWAAGAALMSLGF
jgi:hypothetical protein